MCANLKPLYKDIFLLFSTRYCVFLKILALFLHKSGHRYDKLIMPYVFLKNMPCSRRFYVGLAEYFLYLFAM